MKQVGAFSADQLLLGISNVVEQLDPLGYGLCIVPTSAQNIEQYNQPLQKHFVMKFHLGQPMCLSVHM